MVKIRSKLEEAISYAIKVFDLEFHEDIRSLLEFHPPNEENFAIPVWHSSIRPPISIKFDSNNELHNLFILSFVKLLFRTLKLEFKPEYEGEINAIARKISSKEKTIPKRGSKFDESQIFRMYNENDMKIIEKLIGEIKTITKDLKESDIVPGEFEDDDDVIVDLFHTLANIRAANYNIKEVIFS